MSVRSVLRTLLAALAALICLAAALVAVSHQTGPQMPREALEVNDRPLLTPEQVAEARETGRVAFDCAGKHYVVAGMPAEYL